MYEDGVIVTVKGRGLSGSAVVLRLPQIALVNHATLSWRQTREPAVAVCPEFGGRLRWYPR